MKNISWRKQGKGNHGWTDGTYELPNGVKFYFEIEKGYFDMDLIQASEEGRKAKQVYFVRVKIDDLFLPLWYKKFKSNAPKVYFYYRSARTMAGAKKLATVLLAEIMQKYVDNFPIYPKLVEKDKKEANDLEDAWRSEGKRWQGDSEKVLIYC